MSSANKGDLGEEFDAARLQKEPYRVVLRYLQGSSEGVATCSSFEDKATFDDWYGQNMRDGTKRPIRTVYEIIAEGVPELAVQAIINSPQNSRAIMASFQSQLNQLTEESTEPLSELEDIDPGEAARIREELQAARNDVQEIMSKDAA